MEKTGRDDERADEKEEDNFLKKKSGPSRMESPKDYPRSHSVPTTTKGKDIG